MTDTEVSLSTHCTIEQVSAEQWRANAASFRDHNYRQLWEYGIALARRRGAVSEHVMIRSDNEIVGLADVRLKRLPVVGGGIAYISGGPLTRRGDGGDMERLKWALEALIVEYAQRRGCVLRILAPLGDERWNRNAVAQFQQLGFVGTDRSAAYRTLVVDIARPLPEIRASLAQKWRNCLNSAERKGLVLRSGTNDAIFSEFGELFRQFHARKGFRVDLEPEFYREIQSDMNESDRLIVCLAEQSGKAVAGHVSTLLGDTCVYLLGATSEEGLKSKAAYLLQWNAIVTAKSRGISSYDLGGIDPDENPNVYHFKSGLNGNEVCAAGPYEYCDSTWRGTFTLQAERMRRSIATLADRRAKEIAK